MTNINLVSGWGAQMKEFIKAGAESGKPVIVSVSYVGTFEDGKYIDFHICPCGKSYKTLKSWERHYKKIHENNTRKHSPSCATNRNGKEGPQWCCTCVEMDNATFYGIDYKKLMKTINRKKYKGIGRPRNSDYMDMANIDYSDLNAHGKDVEI